MKRLVFIFLVLSFTANAAEQTVTLSVPGMNCAACPVTVKKALRNVDGIVKTEVDYASKQAVVTFDDSKTSVMQLIDTTTNAGYPSTLKE